MDTKKDKKESDKERCKHTKKAFRHHVAKPEPVIVYQSTTVDEAEVQIQLDRAYDVLFDTVLKNNAVKKKSD